MTGAVEVQSAEIADEGLECEVCGENLEGDEPTICLTVAHANSRFQKTGSKRLSNKS